MITDDYHRDVQEEFRAFGVANYHLCGGGTAADYGSYWRYQDDVVDPLPRVPDRVLAEPLVEELGEDEGIPPNAGLEVLVRLGLRGRSRHWPSRRWP
ncbi:hypothetical protein ACIRPR_30415 [Streptomyces griseoflavus]|uniref:hypothetical protein n=1 Tax=Streptomyces griseoflavus TaxID=35619 RepID=UPI003816D9AE